MIDVPGVLDIVFMHECPFKVLSIKKKKIYIYNKEKRKFLINSLLSLYKVLKKISTENKKQYWNTLYTHLFWDITEKITNNQFCSVFVYFNVHCYYHVFFSESTTRKGFHILYSSNTSTSWTFGTILYNGTSLPIEINFHTVFRFLTYKPPVEIGRSVLEVCEIGIVG